MNLAKMLHEKISVFQGKQALVLLLFVPFFPL